MNGFGERLKAARQRAGLSMRALADHLDGMITYAAIGKYEKGMMQPNSSVLLALARALEVPVDYFFRGDDVVVGHVDFRKKSRLPKKREAQLREQARDFLERYHELEDLLGLIEPPELPGKRPVESPQDAREVACELRRTWQMGLGPVNDLFGLLEEKGIKVLEIEADAKFDGLCASGDAFALIVVNKTFNSVRKRFTVSHEVGHLVMDVAEDTSSREQEKLCHAFAGAFLLPPEVLLDELGHHRHQFSLAELIAMKQNYGISLQAIMAMLHDLRVVSDSRYRRFNMTLNQRGWRTEEPGDYELPAHPARFRRLLDRAVAEEVISLSKAASLAGVPLGQFRREFRLAV